MKCINMLKMHEFINILKILIGHLWKLVTKRRGRDKIKHLSCFLIRTLSQSNQKVYEGKVFFFVYLSELLLINA